MKNFGWPEAMFGDFNDFTTVDAYNQDYASIIDLYTKDKNDIYGIFAVLKKGMEVREFFRIMGEPADRTNFLQSPAMVNAWYQPERNSITFPYAAWNPPYYNLNYPQAYNFAGQGGTGGHELTHGYDDEGVQFGFNGELTDCSWNKCGWMDTNSSSGFIDMAQCVVTQFSTQCCPEKTGNIHCANGATTQGENIADLGGQQAAYRSYRQYVATTRKGVEEDRLPGLENYTPNQIFWITYGYSWCMKQSDANLVHQVKNPFLLTENSENNLFSSFLPTLTHRLNAEPTRLCKIFQSSEKTLDVFVVAQCTQNHPADARSGLDNKFDDLSIVYLLKRVLLLFYNIFLLILCFPTNFPARYTRHCSLQCFEKTIKTWFLNITELWQFKWRL